MSFLTMGGLMLAGSVADAGAGASRARPRRRAAERLAQSASAAAAAKAMRVRRTMRRVYAGNGGRACRGPPRTSALIGREAPQRLVHVAHVHPVPHARRVHDADGGGVVLTPVGDGAGVVEDAAALVALLTKVPVEAERVGELVDHRGLALPAALFSIGIHLDDGADQSGGSVVVAGRAVAHGVVAIDGPPVVAVREILDGDLRLPVHHDEPARLLDTIEPACKRHHVAVHAGPAAVQDVDPHAPPVPSG